MILLIFAAWLSIGGVMDAAAFVSDHWKEITSIAAAVALLVQQWRTAHAAKVAAKAATVAATVAVGADAGAKTRDAVKMELLTQNTVATLDTQERTKTIERMTNGERGACIAHVEAMEEAMRKAGLPIPPKPSILG